MQERVVFNTLIFLHQLLHLNLPYCPFQCTQPNMELPNSSKLGKKYIELHPQTPSQCQPLLLPLFWQQMFLTHLMVQLQSHSGLPQFQNLMWHLPWSLQISRFLVLPAWSLYHEEFTIPWQPALADLPHLKFCHCNRKKQNFPLKKKQPEPWHLPSTKPSSSAQLSHSDQFAAAPEL